MTEVEIEYCVPCGLLPAAEEVTHALLTRLGQSLKALRLVPSHGGVFKVRVGGDVVFDKANDGYDLEEIARRVASSVALLRLRSGPGGGALAAGGAIGLLGIGCSACGVGVLSALLGAGTAATVVAALPLGGLEFGLVGIGLMAVAFVVGARRAMRPPSCGVPPGDE